MTPQRLLADGRRPVVLALMATIGIASYNNLSVAAALPDIGDDLGDISLLPFVITVELLTSAVAVLAAGPIVDGLGARRTFRAATVGFVATSILVAAAPTMPMLVAGRAIQGVFAGAIMTVGVATIGLAIPEALRPRAFALTSAIWGVMGVAGPAIAAILVSTVGWRGIFLVNVPVTAVAAIAGWHRIPDRHADATRQRFDGRGIALIAAITTAALALASYQPVVIAVALVVIVVTVPLYVRRSRRTAHPVVRIPHLLDARYRTVHLTSMAVLAGGVGANSLLPLYLRTVRGQSNSAAAFSVLFLTIGWSTSAWISSRLQDRFAAEWVSLLGAVIASPAAIATALMIHLEAPLGLIYAVFFWLGAGVGMVTSTGAALLQSRTREDEMGRLTGAHQFLRTLAITFGIAIVGAVTLAVVDARVGDVEVVRDLLSDDDVIVSREILESIGDGFAIAIAAMAVLVATSLLSAVHLVRHRGQGVASAP
ncbi:MAG: MFS transporter [Acidimicrobiales bacterium]|nr:MFS transporter [Acidimicrobiales bacterium]